MKEFKLVTMGVDVRGDGLPIIVRGWNEDGRSTLIGKSILQFGGDPAFEELGGIFKNGFSGQKIDLAFIDSGDGNYTERIYRFCHIYKDEILPVKGMRVSGMTSVNITPEFKGQLLDLWLVTLSHKEFTEKARNLVTDCFYVDDRFSDAEGLACAAAESLRMIEEKQEKVS